MNGAYKKKNKFLMLIKNDFLASSRVISLIYILIALLYAGIGACILGGKMDLAPETLEKLMNTSVILFVVAWLVAGLLILVTSFFVIYDFFKSLFGQQGYLSFTLPVSSGQLLGSKVIVYGGWLLVSYIVFILTFFLFEEYFMKVYSDEITTIEMVLDMLGDFPALDQLITLVVWFTVVFFVALVSIVFICYFAISIAHMRLLQKYSLLASIPIVGVIIALFSTITSKVTQAFNLIVVFNDDYSISYGVVPYGNLFDGDIVGLPVTPILVMIALDVGMFFLTSYVMHKKVNLK